MSAADTFLVAEVPRQFKILGVTLRDFSLWHFIVLLRLRNGFVTGEACDAGALIQGIFFCARSWEDGIGAMRDGTFLEQIRALGAEAGKGMEPGKALAGDLGFEERALLFADYLGEGSARPTMLPSMGDESRTPGAPLLQMVKLFLMLDLGWSETQAMNYPFAKALHLFFGFHESRGTARIANEEEIEELAEHEAAAESDEFLQKCLEALPGSVPLETLEKPKAENDRSRKPRKRKGRTS